MNNEAATSASTSTTVEIRETCNSNPQGNAQDATDLTIRHLKLYRAALGGKWKRAKSIIDEGNNIVRERINDGWDYPLHIAVAGKHKGFVENLLLEMGRDDLALENKDDNTALHIAAALGFVGIAKMLVKKNTGLTNILGGGEMIPIHLAALFGHGDMVKYLYDVTSFEGMPDESFINLFHAIISADIYDVAVKMLPLRSAPDGIMKALHLMATKASVISHKNQLDWFENLAYSISKGLICGETANQTSAHKLVEELCNSVTQEHSDLPKILFDAAEWGNFEFLVILIRSNPDIIWITDENHHSLFHIAALHRHESIFNMIHELGGVKKLIGSHRDQNTRNNLLHLVARSPTLSRLQRVSGAALQMRTELLFFKAVEKIVPRSYIKEKNNDGHTARDVFTREHNYLRIEGEKWMKETATACMLVATLIATMVFAAAFTLPGGNFSSDDKNNTKVGFPQFRKKFWFDMFIISDSVALLSSVTSIVIFLSMLTSRYAEDDFRIKLPAKLVMGLLALFVSIISMVLGFTSAMILIRDNEPLWSLIVIIFLAFLVPISYALLHYKLCFETLLYFFKFLFHCKRGLFD